MTRNAVFTDTEFLSALGLNTSTGVIYQGALDDIAATHTPGIVNASGVSVTASGMVVTLTFTNAFAIICGNGTIAKAHGSSLGVDTLVYTLDFTSLVPTTGTSQVYLSMSCAQVAEGNFNVQGPPAGHPDFNPAFAVYTADNSLYNTIVLTATTTPPDNITAIELARVTLSAGQALVLTSQLDYTHQVRAGSILNKTGVTPGTYATPNITITDDGRIVTAALNPNLSSHGLQLSNNIFPVGSSTFTPPTGATTAEIEIIAGGGAGGVLSGADGGGGGGGGSYARIYIDLTTYVMPLHYTVGAGGASGNPAFPGHPGVAPSPGGVSTITDAVGTLIVSCPGGGPGTQPPVGSPAGTLPLAGVGAALPTVGTVLDVEIYPGGNGASPIAVIVQMGGRGGGSISGTIPVQHVPNNPGDPGYRGSGGAGVCGGSDFSGAGGDGFLQIFTYS